MPGDKAMVGGARIWVLACALCCFAFQSFAQEVAQDLALESVPVSVQDPAAQAAARDESEEATSVAVYDQDFFVDYNPISVEDMLNHIPGTEGLVGFNNNQEERRGLRANADQILINGKRLTGKENSSGDYLGSLPAKSVERIEIITGNVRELDADVGSRVINVILKKGAGSGTWQLGLLGNWEGQKRPVPRFSYSGASEALSYTMSLQIRPAVATIFVKNSIATEAGGTLFNINEKRHRNQEIYTGRGSVTYSASGDRRLQLNGFIRYTPRDNTDTTITLAPITLGNIADGLREVGGIAEDIKGEDITWELGADYSQPLGKSAKFNGLFIRSTTTTDTATDTFFRFPNSDLNLLGGDSKDKKATETIARGTVDWHFAEKHDLEVGVEGAINTLDKDLDFFTLVGGTRVDIPFFNSDQDINEDRVEVFTTHSWKPLPALEIQTGVAAEFSWLIQTGSDIGTERSFNFIKPSLDVWYNANTNTQMWFSFLRDVDQLDFDDFVATVNREDDEVLSGNPELAPERSWNFEVGAERRFANGGGVLNGRVFYRRISDVKDLLPLGLSDSQPGNLGSGDHYGIEIDNSLRLKQFFDVDAVLSTKVLIQDSKVTDPFTGLKRRIAKQPKYEFTMSGRYDTEFWGLSFSFDLTKKGGTIESDFNELDRLTTGYDLRTLVEKNLSNGMIVRVFFGNALGQKDTRTRARFVTTQEAGAIRQLEFRRQKMTRFNGISIRGSF